MYFNKSPNPFRNPSVCIFNVLLFCKASLYHSLLTRGRTWGQEEVVTSQSESCVVKVLVQPLFSSIYCGQLLRKNIVTVVHTSEENDHIQRINNIRDTIELLTSLKGKLRSERSDHFGQVSGSTKLGSQNEELGLHPKFPVQYFRFFRMQVIVS